MNKHFVRNLIVLLVMFILEILLFSNTSNAVTDDDGPDVQNSNITWKVTCYSGEKLEGTGFTEDDFTTNEKYGWCEYTKDGIKYVVLGGATHEGLEDPTLIKEGYTRLDKLHYFSYYDTITFKFSDPAFGDDTEYYGIILDTCGVSLDPSGRWNYDETDQILDVFFKESTYKEDINQQPIDVSMGGSLSERAGTKNSTSIKDFFLGMGATVFSSLADGIQILMDFAVTDMSWDECVAVTKTKSDIEFNEKIKKEIELGDPINADDKSQTNIPNMKFVNISKSVDNAKGQKEDTYTTNTEIPVMPVDIYSVSLDNIDFFDVNFFDSSIKNSDKFWNYLRSVVVVISKIVMYLSSIAIFSLIIWRTILLVKSSLGDDPEGAYDSKKIIDDVVKSIVMISMVYFIMIISMYFEKELLKIICGDNNSIYWMKVNVDGVYSFNTNFIGYMKYLTLTNNINAAFGYSFIYLLVQILINGLWFVLMFIRTVGIAGLICIAPLTAVYNMLRRNKKEGSHFTNLLDFNALMKLYFKLLFFPLAMVLLHRFLILL